MALIDPFLDYMSSFHLPTTPDPPSGPSQSCNFVYKLPKVQIKDLDNDKVSVHTFPAPSQPGLLTDEFLEEDDNPMDDIEVPSDQDELLAEPLVAHVHDDYPQPWPPQDFHERMAEHMTCPGICWQALLFDEAKIAYASILEVL